MKKIISMILTVCMIFGTMLVIYASEAPTDAPVIFHNTWNAAPGDALGIYGGNFGTDRKAVTIMLLPMSQYKGEAKPKGTMYSLPVLNITDTLLETVIPEDIEKDNYVIWVKTNAGISEPFFVNKPQIDWVSENDIVPTMSARIFGRNFLNPKTGDGTGARLVLCEVDGTKNIEAKVSAVTSYTVDFIVPDGLTEGKKYLVKYNNGASEYGWASLDTTDAMLCNAKSDKYEYIKGLTGLEISWADKINTENYINVKNKGLKGDGKTDDTDAFVKLLAEIKGTGGVLFFPKGEYNLTGLYQGMNDKNNIKHCNCEIPDKTLLLGEGERESILNLGDQIVAKNASVGIYNFTVKCETVRPENDYQLDADGNKVEYNEPGGYRTKRRIGGFVEALFNFTDSNGRYFIKNVDMTVKDGCGITSGKNIQFILENSNINASHKGLNLGVAASSSKVRVVNNHITNTQRPLLNLGEHAWVENNVLEGNNAGDNAENGGATMEHRICDSSGTEIYIGNNTIIGVFGDVRDDRDDNCGEGIANQAQKRFAVGRVTSSSQDTISDSLQNFGELGKDIVGSYITITYGKGLAQVRKVKSVNGDTVTVDQPWDIIPDTNSTYTIDRDNTQRYIIVENDIQAECRKGGIMLYCKNYDNIIAGNKMTNSGGIWFAKAQNSDPSQRKADYSYFNYVANNELSGGIPNKNISSKGNSLYIGPGDDGGTRMDLDTQFPSTTQYGSIYKGNTIKGSGKNITAFDKYNGHFVICNGICVSREEASTPARQFPAAQGIIVEKNTVTNSNNGVYLSGLCDSTMLYKNNFTGNGVNYNDAGNLSTKTIKYMPEDATPESDVLDVSSRPSDVNAEDIGLAPEITEIFPMEIILVVDSNEAKVNGEVKYLDVPATVISDRTLTPARFVAENLGATVDWTEETQTVTITKGDITIILVIDSNEAIVNGEKVYLDVPAMKINDRTLTPARFVAEKLGATVCWDGEINTVTITD